MLAERPIAPEPPAMADSAAVLTAAAAVAPAEAPTEPTNATEPVELQDWTPLYRCLDWQLGQVAFQLRGAQAFTTQEVPNLINQGGLAAYRSAEVLFAHCVELDRQRALEAEILVMEMAIGLGLFAVQVLDRFQVLCREHGRDYYDRLTYLATDGTPRMVTDARDNGVFTRHAGRVVLGLVDALDPARLVRLDTGEVVDLTGRLRAVLHTYLLCVLPANLFRRQRVRDEAGELQERWGAVMARTVLRHPDELKWFTNLSVEQVVALAQSGRPQDIAQLARLYPLLDLELVLASFEPADISEGADVRATAELTARHLPAPPKVDPDGNPILNPPDPADNVWVLHSAGAQASLRRTLEVLRSDGILLYRDYGPATAERANGNHLYQHYGATTAFGINHFALEAWLHAPGDDGKPRAAVTVPPGEGEASIKTRLVSRGALPATRAAFALQFDPRAFDRLEAVVHDARSQVGQAGGVPMDGYRKALQLERDNWMLLGEAGDVAFRRDRNLELGHVLLGEALRINPWYAASAWNSLGDLHWVKGEYGEARAAYETSARNNPENFRAWLNLADCDMRQGDWAGAVEHAAKALAKDADGSEAERALELLREAARRLGEYRERAARYRKERQAGTPR